MNTRTARHIVGSLAAWTVVLTASVNPTAAQQQPSQPAAGQAGRAPAWLRARLENRLDARTRAAVERVIDSAYAAGVPAEPLVSKALEGSSKGASSEGIVRAVQTLAGNLAVARRALGTQSLAAELASGAEALEVGVDPSALAKLRRDREGQPLAVTLGVLTDLIARNVPVAVATKNVLALSEAGIADEQLVAFQREVERDISVGAPPATAASLRGSGVLLNIVRDGAGSASSRSPGASTRQRP